MNNTKERILLIALKLFAKNGYDAVSVNRISGALGMAKSALYKHYKSKQEIFDSIVMRMNEMDTQRAKDYNIPSGTMVEVAKGYNRLPAEQIRIYAKAQFAHWTEEEFSCSFRKVLTLEQYKNKQMCDLFQLYFVSGPIDYMTDLFHNMTGDIANAKQLALEFYSPIFLIYSLYDATENKNTMTTLLDNHISRFMSMLNSNYTRKKILFR